MIPLAARVLLDRISELGAPEPLLVGPWGRRPTKEDLGRGRAVVQKQEVFLRPPIDWSQDPYGSRSWRYNLHTLSWLRPALLAHAEDGDLVALAAARDRVLDWIAAHVDGGAETSEFAWYDMAVGLRAPYVAYVLRAGLVEGCLDPGDAATLLHSALRHGNELADPDNYAAGNNHGLFQDEGLYLLARQLPVLPEADEWSRLACERLRRTLQETIDLGEGAHLEHSSAYQFVILHLVERLAGHLEGLPWLDDLLERLRATAAWHVTPAGRLAQLGDTDDQPAPNWALAAAADLRGLNALFEAGQAFVRDGDSYLAASAAHHRTAHKHADDTGFILVEGGHVVLGDAGRWGYYEHEPDRLYARSNRAHNVLVADGRDLDWKREQPYGSGLLAAGEGDGWYAISVSNGLLAPQGIAHRRLILYRPRMALVVVDEVRSEDAHDYVRHFHFGPDVAAEQAGDGVAVSGKGVAATLFDMGAGPIELVRGRDLPDRLGWTYPGDRERAPVCTAAMRDCASNATYAAVLSLDDEREQLRTVAVAAEVDRIVVSLGTVALHVEFDGRRAHVSETRNYERQ